MLHWQQFQRQQEQRISWKIRPIYGFEKLLFPSAVMPMQAKRVVRVDPARFIYPRDAMGDMLRPSSSRLTNHRTGLYSPNYNSSKIRSPAWTISNGRRLQSHVHHIGPMAYDSANDTSQLSCQTGWTQIGRRAANTRFGLTTPFYDTAKYQAVGGPCSRATIIAKCNMSKPKPPHGSTVKA